MQARRSLSGLGVLAATLFAASCTRAPHDAAAPAVPRELDHVVVAVRDFARGVAAIERATGVTLRGDWQASTGTGGADVGGTDVRAALLNLADGQFLEIVGPASDRPVPASLVAIFGPYATPTPVGWAIRTDNADSLGAVLASRGLHPGAPREGVWTGPDGSRFSYKAVEGWPGVTTLVPFFVEWQRSRPSPESARPAQCALERVVLNYYAPDTLAARMARASVHVAVEYASARAQGIRVVLRCPAGRVELPLAAS